MEGSEVLKVGRVSSARVLQVMRKSLEFILNVVE